MKRFGWLVFLFCVVALMTACEGTKKNTTDKDGSDDDQLLGDGDELAVADADFAATCGNGSIDGGEPCDDNTEFCTAIDPVLYSGGKAKCLKDCSGYDVATCDEVPHECGNTVKEGPEACDGDTKNCVDIDAAKYGGGKAKCLADCTGYDTATCDEKVPECGNDVIEGTEVCDGGTKLCTLISGDYLGGTASCKADCTGWDTATCTTAANCGNDTLDNGETCDKGSGSTTKVKNCVEIDPYTYSGGKAKCNAACDGWDTATCETLVTDNDATPTDDGSPDYDNELPDTDASCDTCSPSGSERCFNETAQTCTLFGGCLVWSNTDYCYNYSPARTCTVSFGDASCTSACTSECTNGDYQCDPDNVDYMQSCTLNSSDGCYYWTYYYDCNNYGSAYSCVDSGSSVNCEIGCTSECTGGTYQCDPDTENYIQSCTLNNSDGCYYWNFYYDCATGYGAGYICTNSGSNCEYQPTPQTDTIGSNAASYTGGDRLKGNYFSCNSSRTLTGISTYMAFTGGLDITYVVYYASSQTGTYTLMSQKTVNQYSSTGTAGWYSSGSVSISLTSGYYYFIGVFFGTTDNVSYPDPTYYYATTLNSTQPIFGTHLGGGESSTYTTLPSTVSTIDNTYGYYMQLTTQ